MFYFVSGTKVRKIAKIINKSKKKNQNRVKSQHFKLNSNQPQQCKANYTQ